MRGHCPSLWPGPVRATSLPTCPARKLSLYIYFFLLYLKVNIFWVSGQLGHPNNLWALKMGQNRPKQPFLFAISLKYLANAHNLSAHLFFRSGHSAHFSGHFGLKLGHQCPQSFFISGQSGQKWPQISETYCVLEPEVSTTMKVLVFVNTSFLDNTKPPPSTINRLYRSPGKPAVPIRHRAAKHRVVRISHIHLQVVVLILHFVFHVIIR